MEQYSLEWFQSRALSSLEKGKDGVWDYTDSAIIWQPRAIEFYKSLQTKDNAYKRTVTNEDSSLLQKIAPKIVDLLPESFTYIDLGPGTEDKESFFFEAMQKALKKMVYVPVDVHKDMLNGAAATARTFGFVAQPLQCDFESVANLLKGKEGYRFVSIGPTFINYRPQDGLAMLREISGKDGSILLLVQLRDRIQSKQLIDAYNEPENRALIDLKVSLLGFDPKEDLEDYAVTDEVKISYRVKHVPPALKKIGMKEGERILAHLSLRYSRQELEALFKQDFDVTYFDEGYSFIGVFLKPKAR